MTVSGVFAGLLRRFFALRPVLHVGQPLFIIGKVFDPAVPIKTDQSVTDAIKEKTVMGDQNKGTGKFLQTFLQDIQRRDIEIIRRFVKEQDIGRPPHQSGNEDAGLLATGQLSDRCFQLVGLE